MERTDRRVGVREWSCLTNSVVAPSSEAIVPALTAVAWIARELDLAAVGVETITAREAGLAGQCALASSAGGLGVVWRSRQPRVWRGDSNSSYPLSGASTIQ